MNGPVVVEAFDLLREVLLRDVGGEVQPLGVDPDLGAGLLLRRDVDLGGGVVPDQDGGQTGGDAMGTQGLDSIGHLGPDDGGDGLPVDDLGGHLGGSYLQWRKWRRPDRTMANPCSSAAAMISSSRSDPPGWM